MEFVPEYVVERVLDRLDGPGARETRALMKRAGRFQEELVGFAMAFSHEFGPDVAGVTMYLILDVFEMFRALGVKHIRKVTEEEVLQHLERNRDVLRGSPGEVDGLPEMVAVLGPMRERFVMRYVTDTVSRTLRGEGGLDLSTDDACYVFLLLKTIVDCLHGACEWSRIPEMTEV